MINKDKELHGVLFDWDMTLARTMGDVPRSQRLTALFQRGGFFCSHEAVQEAMAVYQRTHIADAPANPTAVPQTQEGIAEYYQELLNLLGYPQISMEKALVLYHDYANLPTLLYDDALPTLQQLQKKEVALGIISNHTQVARKVMQIKVGRYISGQNIVISDEIGAYKPIPMVFQQAAKRMNLQPEQCAFVGDNLEIDAIGAVEQGGFGLGLWLDRKNEAVPRSLPANVNRITSLTEVLDYL